MLSKATDFNERPLKVGPKDDPFARRCQVDFGQFQQTLCRKDRHGLWLSLRNAQYGVELILEDDIVDGRARGGSSEEYRRGLRGRHGALHR